MRDLVIHNKPLSAIPEFTRGSNHVIRGLEHSLPLPDLWREEGAGDCDQSPMANELINHT